MQGLWAVLIILMVLYALYAIARQISQLNYIQHYRFHPAIKQKLKNKHASLTDAQLDLVFQGLRDYFYFCNKARRRMVSMPSQVVDDAWHEFILFTRSYELFCRKAFDRFLHHTPAEAMTTPTQAQDGIKRAWRLACLKEHINPQKPLALPLLFAIDAQLAITGGFIYSLQCGQGSDRYCAGDIGCGGGCSGGGDGGGDSGCGGGCGGD
ncbi:MAG: glycine-rich domain-containing protein [Methylovulum sp.]